MADGVRLAVTLFLPEEGGPWPVILEALPYRKDDQTQSYWTEYRRLRDEGGYAVARIDLRGTGSSEGLATDEYPEQEQRDLLEAIAWLASRRVVQRRGRHVRGLLLGLQRAAAGLRTPPGSEGGRGHLCHRRPLPRRRALLGRGATGGGLRRLPDLHGGHERAAPGPGGLRRRLARGVARARREARALDDPVAGGADRRSVLAPRVAPARLRAHRMSGDGHRRVGRRLPQRHLPGAGAPAGRRARC